MSIKNNYHWFFTECDCDVCELLQDRLVVLHDHLLDHLNVLEGGQPELGNALDVFTVVTGSLFLFLLFLELDLKSQLRIKL